MTMTLFRSLCGECRLTLARAVSARNGPQGRAPGRVVATLLLVIALLRPELFSQQLSLPIQPNSLKFAVIGDNGTGDQPEYDVGARMVDLHRIFPFDMVIMHPLYSDGRRHGSEVELRVQLEPLLVKY